VKKKLSNNNGVKVSLTGGPVLNADMNKASQDDLAKAEKIGLPIALIVLLFAFGGVIAAVIPLIIGLISVVSAMGFLYLLGDQMNLSVFLLNVIPMIGLALGIDFALLLINRFREELKEKTVEESVIIAVSTAGKSIAFSGLCVFLGLSAMLLIQVDIFKTVAIGGMGVVILSVLASLTFLPALLSLLGKHINKLTILKPSNKQSVWKTFAIFVMKRPVMMTIATVILLAIGAYQVKDITLTIPAEDSLPKSYESRTSFEIFESHFLKDKKDPVIFVLDTSSPILEAKTLEKVEELSQSLKKEKMVKDVTSIFSLTKTKDTNELTAMLQNPSYQQALQPVLKQLTTKNKMILYVYLHQDASSKKAQEFAKKWNKPYKGIHITVGGEAKFNQEIFDEIDQKVPYGLLFVFVSTYFILFIAFRSVLIPLKAIAMNVLSLSCTFGILVWLFQGGHFGIEATTIALIIPILVFGIVFGLSMDYEVFLISRIQEIYHDTNDNDYATLEGLTSTSKIITSAALIMIVVTGAFAFTGIIPVKQIGLGISLSILIDATIVRMILVPSLMKLLGKWNWWTPFKKRTQK